MVFARQRGENMSFHYQRQAFPEAEDRTAEREFTLHRCSVSAGRIRSCCGNIIEPRLVELRDDSGQLFFCAVWDCPTCHRVTC